MIELDVTTMEQEFTVPHYRCPGGINWVLTRSGGGQSSCAILCDGAHFHRFISYLGVLLMGNTEHT